MLTFISGWEKYKIAVHVLERDFCHIIIEETKVEVNFR